MHDEAQPARARTHRGDGRPRAAAPTAGPERAQGALELLWNLERALAGSRGCRASSRCSQRGLARRVHRRARLRMALTARRRPGATQVLIPTLPTGPIRATVTMAGLRRSSGRHRRRRRHRRSRRAGRRRARRRADAHQPEHPGALRPQHRGDRAHRSRCRRAALLRRRQPQRRDGQVAPGRHGLRHRALQHAQVLLPAARRRRSGAGPIAVPISLRPSCFARSSRSTTMDLHQSDDARSRSASSAASRQLRLSSCAHTPISARSAPRG